MSEKIKAHGACKTFVGGTRIEQLVKELFTPQGVEFVMKTGFPGLREFRQMQKVYNLAKYGIYLDCEEITLEEKRDVFIIGETKAILKYNELAKSHVCVIHGAKAEIRASGYAVVKVESDRRSKVNCIISERGVILQ